MTDQAGFSTLSRLMCGLTAAMGDTELKSIVGLAQKGERGIETWLSGMLDMGWGHYVLPGLPHADTDTREFQPPLPRRGAADLIIYHSDGTVSVVELKDGAQGLPACQRAIGQVTCVAVHLHPSIRVRRVVAWTPMSRAADNAALHDACLACGVTPIVLPTREQMRRYNTVMAQLMVGAIVEKMKGGPDGPKE